MIETGCACCDGICGCACHWQEEDIDGEYVYCHKCSTQINAYDDPVHVINLETKQALVCLKCVKIYKAEEC